MERGTWVAAGAVLREDAPGIGLGFHRALILLVSAEPYPVKNERPRSAVRRDPMAQKR
jgi:hypothetical protein